LASTCHQFPRSRPTRSLDAVDVNYQKFAKGREIRDGIHFAT
jgi:hypothetical protein